MVAPLFPIKREEKKDEEAVPNWLSVGQSFAPPESQDTRMRAEDFFDISDEEDVEKEKHHKKHKRKKKSETRLQKMLVEVVAQESSSLIPASEVLNNEVLTSLTQGKSEEQIASSLIGADVIGRLRELELRKQVEKAQNLKPIFLEKELPPITYDTIRRDSHYLYGSFLMQDVPMYTRGITNKILGLEDSIQSKQIMKELNEMQGIYGKSEIETASTKIRYFSKRAGNFIIKEQPETRSVSRMITSEDFIPFMRHEAVREESKVDIGTFEFDPSQTSEEERTYLQRTKEFNDKLRKEPKNVKVWLEFINLQDELIKTKYERQKTEKKLAIIEKALNSVDPSQRVELILLFMKASKNVGTQQENFENKIELWKKYLEQYPLSYKLATGYIHFLLENKNISITTTRTLILDAINIVETSKIKHNEHVKANMLIINLLVELCRIEKYVIYYYIVGGI